MQIKYICPFWGKEGVSAESFIRQVIDAGYDGVEVNITEDKTFSNDLVRLIDQNKLYFVAQQYLNPQLEDFEQYRVRYVRKLERLAELNPSFINSHTGRDFWSFDKNGQLIEDAFLIAQKTGVPIYHEIHRGRFTFHSAAIISYLEKYPELRLTADFSHWCTVSESFLEDQEIALKKAIAHSGYIHARVGHTQSPQVNDPFALEWAEALNQFVAWWKEIIRRNQEENVEVFPICPEFGPFPYMPTFPYTKEPIIDQWTVNLKMKDYLSSLFN